MKLMIIASLTAHTGNQITAQRLQTCIISGGHECILVDVNKITEQRDLQEIIERERVAAIIGIHAFRSGKWLLSCAKPFIIVLGGTDVNCHLMQSTGRRRTTIIQVLQRACFVVAFTVELKRRLLSVPDVHLHKIKVIPQGVHTEMEPLEDVSEIITQHNVSHIPAALLNARKHLALPADCPFFLLPTGIRPVKDPTFLVKKFLEYNKHFEPPRCFLVIVGPVLDQSTWSQLRHMLMHDSGRNSGTDTSSSEFLSARGVYYHPPVCRNVLLSWMRQCTAVLNTSLNEGMPNRYVLTSIDCTLNEIPCFGQSHSILEAMAVGTPVIARNNEGCAAIITHLQNGLLFDTSEECLELCLQLTLHNDADSVRLVKNLREHATEYISKQHAPELEKSQWTYLLQQIQDLID